MSSVLKKIDTKTWVIIGLGGVAVVTGYALFSQWGTASLGRQVKRSVLRFLKDTGSMVQNGVVTGGCVQEPLKVNTAVQATVVQMLNTTMDDMSSSSSSTGEAVSSSPSGGGRPPVYENPTMAMDGYQTYASMPPPKSPSSSSSRGGGGKRKSGPMIGRPARGRGAQQRNPASPRAERRTAMVRSSSSGGGGATPASPLEPSKVFRDDGGYAESERRGGRQRSGASFEYNPNDMIPMGRRRASESDLADEGFTVGGGGTGRKRGGKRRQQQEEEDDDNDEDVGGVAVVGDDDDEDDYQ
jgi:hypothetical protein